MLSAYRISKYSKPYLFVDEQLSKLESHGLKIEDHKHARSVLMEIGYFRFSGYAYFFRNDNEFQPGTSFGAIDALYEFDKLLRRKFVEGAELIEVWLRSQVSNRLGLCHPFAHRLPEHLRKGVSIWSASSQVVKRSKHIDWVADYSQEEKRSRGDFLEHFRKKYGPHLPVWAATEIMTFGTLCRLFSLLHEEDCSLIAARAGIVDRAGKGDYGTFSSWLNHFRYLRNLCAHYGRVWNKVFDVTLGSPKQHLEELSNFSDLPHKLYKSIVAMRFLLARICPDSTWSDEMLHLITEFAECNAIALSELGFPESWRQEKVWRTPYRPDLEACLAIDRVNQVASVTQARLLGSVFSDRDEKGRKDFLKYLRGKNAIFAHEVGGTKYYPAFQFNEDLSDIDPNVGDVNEILLSGDSNRDLRIQRAQEWWVSGTIDVDDGVMSPMLAIKKDPAQVFETVKLVSNTNNA